MKITDVRVRKITKAGKMKAVVSITLDNEFVVQLFIAMPSRKTAEGEYRDIAHPINSKTRGELEETILKVYQESLVAADESPEDAPCEEAL